MGNQKGMTLIEILISLGLLVIFGALTVIYLPNYRVGQDLDFDAKNIVAVLRDAQQRSITQDSITAGSVEQWGVHFENPSNTTGFYQAFRGTSYPGTIITYNILKPGIEFADPATGASTDIFFQTISGIPVIASSSVKIRIKNDPTKLKTITVNAYGAIRYY